MSGNMLKRFLTLAVLITSLFLASATLAQESLRVSELEVDLWPEYDRSDVLVIYHVKLPADISLPVDVVFRIPVASGDPHAVAVRQADGALLNAVYDRQVEGDWALITVTATMPEIQLEYYDPNISRENDLRQYTYTWLGDYPVEVMRIVVQQPVGASEMKVVPDLGSLVQFQGDPMQYYTMEVGSPKAGETVHVDLAYSKSSDVLSIESLPVQSTGPINGDDGSPSTFMAILPWLIGGLGLFLLAGGGFWYWQLRSAEAHPVSQKRGRRAKATIKSPEQLGADSNGQAIYCHQCGKRAASGDRFCRVCGTKLRS